MRVAGELAEREGDDRVREEHVREAQEKVEKNRVLRSFVVLVPKRSYVSMRQQRFAAQSDDGSEVRPAIGSISSSQNRLMLTSIIKKRMSIK